MADNKTIKEVMREEYAKCSGDPIYFMKKYVYIQTSKGRSLFGLYKFQEKLLFLLNKHDRTLILKSRQLGITTLCAGYSLWLMIFHKDKSILALAPTQEKAKNIVDKVRFAYAELPSWLKVSAIEDNKLSLVLTNGSKIKAASGASESARGYTANVLILDEAAFIENAEDLWGSAQQTLATGGQAIVLSTPNGVGQWFHKMWADAEMEDNNFIPIRLPWKVHPDRDQTWRDAQDKELGKKMASQECDCDFLNSGDTFFDTEDLEYYAERVEEPINMTGPRNDHWTWEYPIPDRTYIVAVDTARGDGNDNSTIQVIDIYSGTQVAEYRGDMDTKMLSKFAVSTCIQYNDALLVIENTGIGQSTMSDVIEIGYNNIYYSPKGDSMDVAQYQNKFYEHDISRMTAGFTASTKTRPQILNNFKQYIHEHSILIRSKRTYMEMSTFIWKNGKAQAQNGYNDDLVIPYAMAMFLRDSALQFRSQGVEMQRAVLNNIRRQSVLANSTTYDRPSNPYQFNVNGQMEDITWLIR